MTARSDYPTLDLLTRSHIFDGKHGAVDDALVEIDHLRSEVDRLRSELLKANADTERLEVELAEARRQP